MGCGRWPGRLPFGTGLRRYATRPSRSSSAWHRVASGVPGTSRGSGEDRWAHPPREIPTTNIMEGTRKRSITGPSHPHSPECVEGKVSRNRSRRDPPRSVPPPTVLTGGHPCPGARLAPQVERREVLEYWANNSVRGVSYGHFGDLTDGCPWAVLRCVPEPAHFARELGEALRPRRGARPTERRSAARGDPMEGRVPPWRVVISDRRIGRPRPGVLRPGDWPGPPTELHATDASEGRARCQVDGGGPRTALRTTSAFLMYRSGAPSNHEHKKPLIPSARTTPPCVPNPSGRSRAAGA